MLSGKGGVEDCSYRVCGDLKANFHAACRLPCPGLRPVRGIGGVRAGGFRARPAERRRHLLAYPCRRMDARAWRGPAQRRLFLHRRGPCLAHPGMAGRNSDGMGLGGAGLARHSSIVRGDRGPDGGCGGVLCAPAGGADARIAGGRAGSVLCYRQPAGAAARAGIAAAGDLDCRSGIRARKKWRRPGGLSQ